MIQNNFRGSAYNAGRRFVADYSDLAFSVAGGFLLGFNFPSFTGIAVGMSFALFANYVHHRNEEIPSARSLRYRRNAAGLMAGAFLQMPGSAGITLAAIYLGATYDTTNEIREIRRHRKSCPSCSDHKDLS